MLRLGLIGCGEMGSLRAAALSQTSHLRLHAVSDVDEKRATQAAALCTAAVEKDWQSLIERSDIDAVVISTPPNLHRNMSIEAMRAGKHVLCEKPLARSAEESREMIATAEKAQVLLATGFNYRFYPSFELAREWLRAGVIGKLSHIKSYSGYSARDHHQAWLHDPEITGGGALRDNGIHLIDLTRHFLGEVSEVRGFASNRIWKFKNCEDNGFLTMRNQEHVIASVHASWTEFRKYRFAIELFGDLGTIRVCCFPMFAELIQFEHNRAKPSRKAHYFPYLNIMEHLKSYRWIVIQSLIKELDAFAAAVRKEPGFIATGYDGLRAIEIAAAVEQRFE